MSESKWLAGASQERRRVNRCMAIRDLIERERHTAVTLSATFGVTRRTIYRDIQRLQRSGVPVIWDPIEERYELEQDTDRPAGELELAYAVSRLESLLSRGLYAEARAVVDAMEGRQ